MTSDRDRLLYSTLTVGCGLAPDYRAQDLLSRFYSDLMGRNLSVEVAAVLLMGGIRDGLLHGWRPESLTYEVQELKRRKDIDDETAIVTKADAEIYMTDVVKRKDIDHT